MAVPDLISLSPSFLIEKGMASPVDRPGNGGQVRWAQANQPDHRWHRERYFPGAQQFLCRHRWAGARSKWRSGAEQMRLCKGHQRV